MRFLLPLMLALAGCAGDVLVASFAGDSSGGDAIGGDASGGDASGDDASGDDASGDDASGDDAPGGDVSHGDEDVVVPCAGDCDPATPGDSDPGAPAVPSVRVCPTSWDRRPIVQFDPLPAGQTYEVFADGASIAVLHLPGQNYFRPAQALGPGAPPPGAEMELRVRACNAAASLCSDSEPAYVRLIEACTEPVAPSPSNLVFSEYVVDGDGLCPGPDCEAGEAIELTNLSHCPVELDGHHFSYCNQNGCGAWRWMDFATESVIPPRGVYVAIRNLRGSACDYPHMTVQSDALFGLRISTLSMSSASSLDSGWFNNAGGGRLRAAGGAFVDMDTGATIALVDPYSGLAGSCQSIGYDAREACGDFQPDAELELLPANQLGRLWHPCDAIADPFPSCE